jgi:hypothetical protein
MESVSTYVYDPAGHMITQTAPGGLVVNTAYDADNHVVSQIIDPSGVDRTVSGQLRPRRERRLPLADRRRGHSDRHDDLQRDGSSAVADDRQYRREPDQ